ncbi:MAG: hypothetical protein M1837_004271 [Sclerophora amabilis]|nr:MAG: hypothetical protein M1837_004271 [Sclerophora amabilis]
MPYQADISDTSDEDSISLTSTAASEEREEYPVEEILAESTANDDEDPLYLVKWLGYPSTRSTWEPVGSFTDESTLREWAEKKKRIECGDEEPFDLDDFETRVEAINQETEDRKARRDAKRERLRYAEPHHRKPEPRRRARGRRRRAEDSSEDDMFGREEWADNELQPRRGKHRSSGKEKQKHQEDDEAFEAEDTSEDSLMEELRTGRRRRPAQDSELTDLRKPKTKTSQLTNEDAGSSLGRNAAIGIEEKQEPKKKEKSGIQSQLVSIDLLPRAQRRLSVSQSGEPFVDRAKPIIFDRAPAAKPRVPPVPTRSGINDSSRFAPGVKKVPHSGTAYGSGPGPTRNRAPEVPRMGKVGTGPARLSDRKISQASRPSQSKAHMQGTDVLRNWAAPPPKRHRTKPIPGFADDPHAPMFKHLSIARKFEKAARNEPPPNLGSLQLFAPDERRRSIPKVKTPNVGSNESRLQTGQAAPRTSGGTSSAGHNFEISNNDQFPQTFFAESSTNTSSSSSRDRASLGHRHKVAEGPGTYGGAESHAQSKEQSRRSHQGRDVDMPKETPSNGSGNQSPRASRTGPPDSNVRQQGEVSSINRSQDQSHNAPLRAVGDIAQPQAAVEKKSAAETLNKKSISLAEYKQRQLSAAKPTGKGEEPPPASKKPPSTGPKIVPFAGTEYYAAEYRRLLPPQFSTTHSEHNFCLIFPPEASVDMEMTRTYLLKRVNKVFTIDKEGDWESFCKDTDAGVILVHASHTGYWKLSHFARTLLKPINVFVLASTFSPSDPRITPSTPVHFSADPSTFIVDLMFPQGGAILFTEDLILSDPSGAWKVMRWFLAMNKEHGNHIWKLVGRPAFKDWVCKQGNDSGRRESEPRQVQEDRWRIWIALSNLLSSPHLIYQHPFPDPHGHTQFTPWPHSPVLWPDMPPDFDEWPKSDLIEWFAGWTLTTKRHLLRHFIVVEPEPRPATDARKDQWGHVDIVTPAEFMDVYGKFVTEEEMDVVDREGGYH